MKALGGSPLHGDKLVRLVYLDEAGISNPQHEPIVTVAGIVVHGDKLKAVELHLEKLVKDHVPKRQRRGFIFHAKEIFYGGKFIKRDDPHWTEDRRIMLADELADIPRKFDLQIALGWSKRAEFPYPPEVTKAMDKTLLCLAESYVYCCIKVDLWMRKHAKNENCLMIMEDNKDARTTLRAIQNKIQKKSLRSPASAEGRKWFPLKHIREDPLFQAKRPTSVLEVADFCAYVFKKLLMNPDDPRFIRFLVPMHHQILGWDGEVLPEWNL